eukprot:scaffold21153_cov34-Tisochrysis_lutea.AAC.2
MPRAARRRAVHVRVRCCKGPGRSASGASARFPRFLPVQCFLGGEPNSNLEYCARLPPIFNCRMSKTPQGRVPSKVDHRVEFYFDLGVFNLTPPKYPNPKNQEV